MDLGIEDSFDVVKMKMEEFDFGAFENLIAVDKYDYDSTEVENLKYE